MRTCCLCGKGYQTRGGEDKLIYGCRACHKGYWQTNQRDLQEIEIINKRSLDNSFYPYGKASYPAKLTAAEEILQNAYRG